MLHNPSLYLLNTHIGRGVFAGADIEKGSVIEVCPLILLDASDTQHIDKTKLFDYYFVYPDDKEATCIALGYGSLYNHSDEPNGIIIFDLQSQEIIIESTGFIAATSEITIDYTGGDGRRKLWF